MKDDLISWWCINCKRVTLWRKEYNRDGERRVCEGCNHAQGGK